MVHTPLRKRSAAVPTYCQSTLSARWLVSAVWVCFLCMASGSFHPIVGQGGIITTVVGGGPNGTMALSADIGQPGSVTIDPAGNVIVAANAMNQVFKIDTMGNFSVLTGTGVYGFSGDGGSANAARLAAPWGVATDRLGNVFIVDTGNQRIRRVDATSGIITTVAGNGVYAFSGDGGPATSASLWDPQGLGLDSVGNLFIADYGNCRIRRVDASTGIITTVAGNGIRGFSGDGGPATSAQLSLPWSVSVDISGNLFIADADNHRVRRVDATTHIITTFAGGGPGGIGDGGPATSAFLNGNFGSVLDHAGNLLIADAGNERIRKVDHSTGIITTIAGSGNSGFTGDNGAATSATLNFPMSVAVDSLGNLIIADTFNNHVRRVDAATGKIATLAGGGTGGDGNPATNAILVQPYGISLDPAGNIFIADTLNQRIRRVDASSGNISTVAGAGWQGTTGDGGAATSAALFDPRGVAVDSLGNIYIGNAGNSTLRQVAPTGTISSGSMGLVFAGSVGVDASGNLFIADSGAQKILRVDHTTGSVTTVAGTGTGGYFGDGGPAIDAGLNLPQGVALDVAGNLFIADTSNNVIRRVDAATGIISTVAGTGAGGFSGDGGPATAATLAVPERVAVDSLGNLFIADLVNNRIRRVDTTTGVITTVAGTGTLDFSGDGGPAVGAALNTPSDVAVDKYDYLYIVDLLNNRVRRVSPAPNATLSAKSLTFSKQVVGTVSSAQTIKLTNAGPQLLGFTGVAISGTNAADFAVTHDCAATLAAAQDCTISVTFTPTAGASRTAVLTITDTSSDGPQTVHLTGTGFAPTETVNLSSASLDFGTVLEGTTSATQSVTVTNSGTNILNISKISVVGINYSQTNTCGTSVAAGGTCTITVSYAPSSSGTNQTRIDIADDGINSPQSITLSGSGTEFLLTSAAGSSTAQTVDAGNSAHYALTLTPSTGTRDTVTLSCAGAPATVSCSVLPTTQTFTSTAPVAVTVDVSTMARGVAPPMPSDRFLLPVTMTRAALLLAYLTIVAVAIAGWRCSRRAAASLEARRSACPKVMTLLGSLCVVLMAAACGGGSSTGPGTGTPQGTYHLSVTVKSASSTNPDQTVPLTLVVQ
jgi:sugar lactone lactonase YvrE